MLPSEYTKKLHGLLDKFGTTIPEAMTFFKAPPPVPRQKEIIKKILLNIAVSPLEQTLSYLQEKYGDTACIIIRNVPTDTGRTIPRVFVVTHEIDAAISIHEDFYFHDSGDIVIDTVLDEKTKSEASTHQSDTESLAPQEDGLPQLTASGE